VDYRILSRQQAIEILRWSLYSVMFVLSVLIDSTVLPRIPIGGITLCSVPVCMACVAVREGAQRSCIFALFAGIFYALSGVNLGAMYILMLTVSAVLCGGICDFHFNRGFISSVILGLFSLMLCRVPMFLFRLYLGTASAAQWQTVLVPEIFFSVLLVPLFHLLSWPAAKVGR